MSMIKCKYILAPIFTVASLLVASSALANNNAFMLDQDLKDEYRCAQEAIKSSDCSCSENDIIAHSAFNN